MATFEQVRQALGRRLGPHVAGTASGGSTTTLTTTDSRLYASSGIRDAYFEDWWIHPTSGNEDGNTRLVTAYDASAGKFTVTAWSTGPANNDTFELYGRMHPVDMKLAVEDALRKMYYLHTFPLTLVTDGDMETSGTSSWSSTNATETKDTGSGDVHELGGTQSLQVVTSATNGYTQSDNVAVESGSQYHIWADLRADGAFTARLQVWDVTNSASIDTEDWTDNDWGTVDFAFTAPSGCDNVAVRIVGVQNSATIHADNVSLLRLDRHTYALPSWLTQPHNWVEQVLALDGDRPQSKRIHTDKQLHHIFHDATAVRPASIYFKFEDIGRPLYIQALRPYLADASTVSGDSTTISANMDWIVTVAETEAYARLRDTTPSTVQSQRWAQKYQEASLRATLLYDAYQPPRAPRPVQVSEGSSV
jgi:hypothetical protein